MAESFNPKDHLIAGPRKFADLKIGEVFRSPSRTVTDAHFAAFQVLSGDNHPSHYDVEYCRSQGHRDLVAQGLQTLAFTAVGAGIFPHMIGPSLIGFIAQSCRFLRPVCRGDTLYPVSRIAALTPQRTTGIVTMDVTIHNQSGELVLEGEQKFLLRI